MSPFGYETTETIVCKMRVILEPQAGRRNNGAQKAATIETYLLEDSWLVLTWQERMTSHKKLELRQ